MADHDLLVLGGGTGGYAAAFRASQLGKRVALIEQAKVGGTCLHWGCIPAKAMLESGDLLAKIGKAADYGIQITPATGIDTTVVGARRDKIVAKMHAGLKSLFKKNNVELIAARGTITAPGTVNAALVDEAGQPTGEARTITATDIVVATGSSVRSIPGLETDGTVIVDSDDIGTGALHPKRVIVVGGGAAAVGLVLELGQRHRHQAHQVIEAEGALDSVEVFRLHAGALQQQIHHRIGHLVGHLQAHHLPAHAAFAQALLQGLHQVVGLQVAQFQVGVAGDTEEVVALHLHAGEQQLQVEGHHLL